MSLAHTLASSRCAKPSVMHRLCIMYVYETLRPRKISVANNLVWLSAISRIDQIRELFGFDVLQYYFAQNERLSEIRLG